MIQASTRIGIVPLSSHIFSIRIMFQNQSVGGLVGLKSDSQKPKSSNLEKIMRPSYLLAKITPAHKFWAPYRSCRRIRFSIKKFKTLDWKKTTFLGFSTKIGFFHLKMYFKWCWKKVFRKFPKLWLFSQSKVLIFFIANRLRLYTYDTMPKNCM